VASLLRVQAVALNIPGDAGGNKIVERFSGGVLPPDETRRHRDRRYGEAEHAAAAPHRLVSGDRNRRQAALDLLRPRARPRERVVLGTHCDREVELGEERLVVAPGADVGEGVGADQE